MTAIDACLRTKTTRFLYVAPAKPLEITFRWHSRALHDGIKLFKNSLIYKVRQHYARVPVRAACQPTDGAIVVSTIHCRAVESLSFQGCNLL